MGGLLTICEIGLYEMGDAGLEHPLLEQSKTTMSTSGGAKSGAPDAPNAPQSPQDPDLALVVKRWPELPAHIKAAIKALIAIQTKGDQE